MCPLPAPRAGLCWGLLTCSINTPLCRGVEGVSQHLPAAPEVLHSSVPHGISPHRRGESICFLSCLVRCN